MATNQSQRRNSSPVKGGGGTFLGAVFLGICILIAGLNIGGNLKKLNKTVETKVFSTPSTYNAPSEISYSNPKYLTEDEAGIYLNISTQNVVDLITKGDITEYVKTESGYSISITVLDAWFENEAYQNKLNNNASNAADES